MERCASYRPLMRWRLPGPQEPAQAVSLPVIWASAPAAKAAVSSCRTWIQSIAELRRMASTTGLRLSPTTPYRRLTPARARMSTNCSATFCLAMLHAPLSGPGILESVLWGP